MEIDGLPVAVADSGILVTEVDLVGDGVDSSVGEGTGALDGKTVVAVGVFELDVLFDLVILFDFEIVRVIDGLGVNDEEPLAPKVVAAQIAQQWHT